MSTLIDQEIFKLSTQGHTASSIAVALIELIESSPSKKNYDNISAIARYLLLSGQEVKLISYVLENFEDKSFQIPWPYFLEALTPLANSFSNSLTDAMAEGIIEQNAQLEASRSEGLKKIFPELDIWDEKRRTAYLGEYKNKKTQLFDQLAFLRAQRLYEQEKELLKIMQSFFPDDPMVKDQLNEHKQRYALEILSRKKPKQKSLINEALIQIDSETQKVLDISSQMMREVASQDPSAAFDFAVAAFMVEAYEEAYELLQLSPENESIIWFKLEVLLKTRRFVELLSALSIAEKMFADDPETFFATAYLRAQALWGLGQKSSAKEVLEGLLAARPSYRAAGALYSIWSQ